MRSYQTYSDAQRVGLYYDGHSIAYEDRSVPWLGWVNYRFNGEAADPSIVKWIMDGVREFFTSALTHLRDVLHRSPVHRRDRYLLAVPLINCGFGGGQEQTGVILRELVGVLADVAEGGDADVALCLVKEAEFAAAQQIRTQMWREQEKRGGGGGGGRGGSDHLTPALREEADRLADYAKRCV